MASNAENVSIWWRHHGLSPCPEWALMCVMYCMYLDDYISQKLYICMLSAVNKKTKFVWLNCAVSYRSYLICTGTLDRKAFSTQWDGIKYGQCFTDDMFIYILLVHLPFDSNIKKSCSKRSNCQYIMRRCCFGSLNGTKRYYNDYLKQWWPQFLS